MAPLVKELEKTEDIESIVCVTGQHREMLDQVLSLFDIVPDYDLDIMAHGQTVVDIITKSMKGLEEVLNKEHPDVVLVHGDTSTSSAAAQIAFLHKIPVGHVEAGLRSFNIYSPFPEEMNRKMISTMATYHFAPTKGNAANLINEGRKKGVIVTGNTVIDALNLVIEEDYQFEDQKLNEIDFDNKKVIVLTCHRRENWGDPMESIFDAIIEIVENNEDVEVIYPVHLNPRIRKLANYKFKDVKGVTLVEPLDYKPFANLINKSYLVMTDSGGIQEEAPALGKPVLVIRTETERPEAVEAGTVKVIGVEFVDIVDETTILIRNEKLYNKMSQAANPYGDGQASKRIIEYLLEN
jgi:UDP-N-acetylglucosamine 2-epimerase (non-hydrolysing)